MGEVQRPHAAAEIGQLRVASGRLPSATRGRRAPPRTEPRERSAPSAAAVATALPRTRGSRRSQTRAHRFAERAADARSGLQPVARDRSRGRTCSTRAGRPGRRGARPPDRPPTRRDGRARSRARSAARAPGPDGRRGRREGRARDCSAGESTGRRALITLAPRLAYSSGIAQACPSRIAPSGNMIGTSIVSPTAASVSGTACESVVSVHSRPRWRSDAADTWRAPRAPPPAPAVPRDCRARPGGRPRPSSAGPDQPPAIGRRRMTSGASSGSSRTCSAWPSPWEMTAK